MFSVGWRPQQRWTVLIKRLITLLFSAALIALFASCAGGGIETSLGTGSSDDEEDSGAPDVDSPDVGGSDIGQVDAI